MGHIVSKQVDGGFMVSDIPSDLVNAEYLQLLLDESSRMRRAGKGRG